MRRLIQLFALATLVTVAGFGSRPAAATTPTFTHPLDITNPYRPFVPGTVKVFSGQVNNKLLAIVDLYLAEPRTFQLDGNPVPCRAIQETEFSRGQLIEISTNYSAQSDDGTVYYFGEVVDNYENGIVVRHDGSWLVGGPTLPTDPPTTFTTTTPGIFMPPNPQVGDTFKVEDLTGFLDEKDTIQKVNISVGTPAGKFGKAIQVLETSALLGEGPGETKWYVPGIGVVKGKTRGEHFELLGSSLLPQ